MTDDRIYVAEIAERIERIFLYTTEGREAFFESLLIQDAVIRNFEVIGEATKQLSRELRPVSRDTLASDCWVSGCTDSRLYGDRFG